MKSTPIAIALVIAASTSYGAPTEGRDPELGEKPNPEDVVAEIIADYDANEDNVVNAEELSAALVGLREHRLERRKEALEQRENERMDRERRPEPEAIADLMIERFDKDSDDNLNSEELMAAIDSMHDKRHHHRGGRR